MNCGWSSSILLIIVLLFIYCVQSKVPTIINEQARLYSTESVIINSDIEYSFTYSDTNAINPYRIHVWSTASDVAHPVLVVVKQERRITSWQVPLLVTASSGVTEHRNTSRILCYDPAENENTTATSEGKVGMGRLPKNFTVNLSTSSPIDVLVHLRVDEFVDYYIESTTNYSTAFSPSQPVYFSYDFANATNKYNDEIKTVKIYVNSEIDSCFTVSVQQKACPVRDLNDGIISNGKYQTVKTVGALTIMKRDYQDGFFLVMVAKGDNHDCSQENSLLPMPEEHNIIPLNQSTFVTFSVVLEKSRNAYLGAIMLVLWTNLGAFVLIFLITFIFYWYGPFKGIEKSTETEMEKVLIISKEETNTYFEKEDLMVSDFVKKGSRNKRKALNYFWHIGNIAIFYGLPVVQLMVSYQRVVNISGNLDICYHNFLCSHPLYFTDFNHIYSNVGYIIFGILFLCITLFRDKKVYNMPDCGIPKFYGLYYAMGLALIFEGVLSGCYHICPNQSNFQFDTSFMYIMSVLIMVKLYQNRHPDINASAYGTFGVLGVAIALAMFGIMFNSLAVMIIFIICYIILCIYMALNIYFFGRITKGWSLMYHSYKVDTPLSIVLKPIRMKKCVMLLIANLLNIAVAITGLVLYPSRIDFGSFLLMILLMNAVLYGLFYMIMKLLCKERICVEAIIYGISCLVCWGVGCYYYMDASTLWTLTPAESRELNSECVMMEFYDKHDVWHLLSAPALFLTFMFIMVMDDDLYKTRQDQIIAF